MSVEGIPGSTRKRHGSIPLPKGYEAPRCCSPADGQSPVIAPNPSSVLL